MTHKELEDDSCTPDVGDHVQIWPPEQPPVTPLEPWGPAAAGVISRGWYWKPGVMRGYTPILRRVSVRTKGVVSGEYSSAVAPRILIAFLDPKQNATPSENSEFNPVPAALLAPLSAEPLFFAPAGTEAIVNATNFGKGYEFGMRNPRRYRGIWVACSRIGTGAEVQVTPVIEYVPWGES